MIGEGAGYNIYVVGLEAHFGISVSPIIIVENLTKRFSCRMTGYGGYKKHIQCEEASR